MLKILIAAVAKNKVIGKSNGEILWHSKEEMKHFKETTWGFPIIIGRQTFDVLGKPLKGRLNIVLSNKSKMNEKFSSIIVFNTLKKAYEYCKSKNFEKAFIIGGGQVFKKAIVDADEMIISHMDFEAEGDVYFPRIDLKIWSVAWRKRRKGFEIVGYERK